MATLNPYLNFRGQARDVLDFYHAVFGGELNVMTFGEQGVPAEMGPPDQVMHGQLETTSGFTLMVSDTPDHMPFTPGNNIAVSLSGPATDEAELTGYFQQLSEGGTPGVPLEKAPWGDQFGMVTDKFGTNWLVNISGA